LAGHAKPIRIMSEDYTLYRGHSGTAQIVAHRCPHRGAPMHLGWIEDDSIRCVHHGWKFDCSGHCVEQPAEQPGFARKVIDSDLSDPRTSGSRVRLFRARRAATVPAFSLQDRGAIVLIVLVGPKNQEVMARKP
jgi:nitrite reductase/ring-hydroxylating ferredoxin subunit